MSALVKKLAEVMAAVGRIPKRGHNNFHNYDYATEADIVEAIRSELAQRQVMLLPGIDSVSREAVGEKGSVLTTLTMSFTFLDGETGETLTRPWLGAGTDKEDKGAYKAMTGGEKYFLLKTFLIPTGDDPEATTREERAEKRQADKATVKPDRATKKARVMPDAAKADGAVFVEKVIPKVSGNKEWAEVVLSTGESVIAREPGAISLAVNLAQEATPVIVTTRKNGKGNTELDALQRWPIAVPEPVALTAADVGF